MDYMLCLFEGLYSNQRLWGGLLGPEGDESERTHACRHGPASRPAGSGLHHFSPVNPSRDPPSSSHKEQKDEAQEAQDGNAPAEAPTAKLAHR